VQADVQEPELRHTVPGERDRLIVIVAGYTARDPRPFIASSRMVYQRAENQKDSIYSLGPRHQWRHSHP
jgi:hypothetical protein